MIDERSARASEAAEPARDWLRGMGLRDLERGARDVDALGRRARPASLARLVELFDTLLPRCPDPDMALANFERYVAALPDPADGLDRLLAGPRTVEILLQVLSTSQHLGELLIRDPGLIDWLQAGAGRRDRDSLISELWEELSGEGGAVDPRIVIRRFRLRETLRIGYDDIIRGVPLEVTTADLSHLAEACVEAATRLARESAERRHGAPTRGDGAPARFAALAMGKLGGVELNYSSDIDLIFLYDEEGATTGPRAVSNAEFFARMSAEIVRLLSDHTAMGFAYRVDMRLRPEGDQGVLARSLDATLNYYVSRGRTWERQALIKCRPIAGDPELGAAFIAAVTPFVYRRYLGAAEIAEIKSLKRRIEQRTASAGLADFEVKTGRGGIRDVEFVVQFLQLLHGGEYPSVRVVNTLEAIERLERAGSLTAEERGVMDRAYRFLRRVEHRLQILFDRQTHEMPRSMEELRTLAIRMGYMPLGPSEGRFGPAERFLADYRAKTELNRRILNHILHQAFLHGEGGEEADPVVDLVLDPDPSDEQIAAVLSRYPFQDPAAAYRNLMALAREDFAFLSQARCRHFLASIAPRLLRAVGRTADPDLTLTNLERVSASLGAKAVLWELFALNPPSLRLYVELCATSQLVSGILTNNPGMIDDLMDSLAIDRPLPGAAIKGELAELTRGSIVDLAPILWSFRNKEWVRIGARDLLERESIRDVTRELADVAEAILGQVARDQWPRRLPRYGAPIRAADGARDRWAILALGKLGGRELNYHSDLDLVFLHESDGHTAGPERTSNHLYVTDVAQRILKALAGGSGGVLYQVDTRLRPHGAAGPLVNTLEAFTRYHLSSAQSWERMALTRGRVVFATGGFRRHVAEAIRSILVRPVDPLALGRDVVAMRRRLEESRGPGDLKRGVGGLADIEFVVQYLMLVHAAERPDVLRANTWEAMDALTAAGVLPIELHRELREIYNFLFSLDARLRLIRDRAGSDLPTEPDDLTRLARRLKYDVPDATDAVSDFLLDAARHTTRARAIFQQVVPGVPPEG
ncbi:bifunctional [glutamate--ammonia ligase]-adenylyl-L-tyrosine phosphorylase/[glutamate--ammonia-ligase] adenylyltransferase [Paludisphaera sp.]|uniref:bifunctional [glutamate--ammonia ligase]-adenylyl-L-tyrosine phosphorylase/[glutamate--ammonia-ligase] adenylyltransferase n=1 Tax=Paludisphaera sp. TaxID=2017432 RepID=UPI00301BE0F8